MPRIITPPKVSLSAFSGCEDGRYLTFHWDWCMILSILGRNCEPMMTPIRWSCQNLSKMIFKRKRKPPWKSQKSTELPCATSLSGRAREWHSSGLLTLIKTLPVKLQTDIANIQYYNYRIEPVHLCGGIAQPGAQALRYATPQKWEKAKK